MRIRALTLRPFRNFGQIELSFADSHTLIYGPNGRGKTNILEAISYLSIGKSVRGTRDQQAVPHEGEYFDIEGSCTRGLHSSTLRVFFSRRDGKRAFSDGVALPRVSDLLGQFRSVHFSPEDVSLVLRFPAQRRRLLDILVSQASPEYLRWLQRYQRVLAQRNALLKELQRGRSSDAGALSSWTSQLAELGGSVRAARLATLEGLRGPLVAYHRRFVPAGEEADIQYRGADAGVDQATALLAELEKRRPGEVAAGHTLCGPHRDDIDFTLSGKPADAYASEGQLKTIMVAWKLAEVDYLSDQDWGQPVLLLDDVLSELDARRSRELMELVTDFEQVVITTPTRPDAGLVGSFEQLELGD